MRVEQCYSNKSSLADVMHFVCLVSRLPGKKVLIRRLKRRNHIIQIEEEETERSETPKETEVIRLRLFGPLPN